LLPHLCTRPDRRARWGEWKLLCLPEAQTDLIAAYTYSLAGGGERVSCLHTEFPVTPPALGCFPTILLIALRDIASLIAGAL